MGLKEILKKALGTPEITEDGLKYQVINNEIKIVGYKKHADIQKIPSHIEDMPVGIISGLAGIRMSGTVSVPNTVHTIESETFSMAEHITEVILPDTVDLSGADGLFLNCISLKQVHLPSGMTKIPAYFLVGCRALEEITIPDGVTEICEMAFWQCEKLRTVHLPESLKIIGKMAFADCTALTDAQLPLGLREVGEDAFAGCPALETAPITDIGGM